MNPATSPSPRLSRGAFLLALGLGAFVIRLALLLVLRDISQGPHGPASNDDVQFDHLAQSLTRGDGFVNVHRRATSFRAPGFSFMLAAQYWLVGPNPILVYLSFCLMGALSSVLTYVLAREVLDETPARWAGILAALYLGHIFFALNYVSENPFVPVFILGLWLFIRSLKTRSMFYLAGAGLILGFATLIRPFALLTLPLLGLVKPERSWYRPRTFLLSGLAFALPFLACILPWTWRNYQVHGRFVLIASNGGSTFYGGNNDLVVTQPRLWGLWVSTTELPGRDLIDAQPDEISRDQMEWKLGKDWVLNHPERAALLCLFKVGRLVLWPSEFDAGYYWLRGIWFAPFVILYVLGMARCFRHAAYRTPAWWALHLTMLATLLTALIFWGSARFRDANLAPLLIYAVVGAQAVAQWWNKKQPLAA